MQKNEKNLAVGHCHKKELKVKVLDGTYFQNNAIRL